VDLDALLGIDLTDPSQRLARLLAVQDEALVDRLVEIRKAGRMSQQDVADAMGISQSAVARIESGARDPRLSTLRRYAHAVGALVTHSVAVYPPDTSRLFSYAELAQMIVDGEDWSFAVRLLREVVRRSHLVGDAAGVDFIHRDPGLTGIRGWDAIIGGVASMSGRGRVSDPTVLQWCFDPERYCTDEMFNPFTVPAKYFWTDYLRTPIELQVRNVILPSGNLEGV
jgi:transcriptional regulator with XRE-family HTH domain